MMKRLWPSQSLQDFLIRFCFLALLSATLLSQESRADLLVHLGPAAEGGGGPNPISIPPTNILDYEVVWITEAKREYSVAFVPGLFYGQRYTFLPGGLYLSLGGGLVIDLNGFGPGIYSAFGYDGCAGFICFNIEYKQALGITLDTLIAPYAIRLGLMWKIY